MVVRTQSFGRGTTGLYIGTRNARRFFKRQADGIELHLGHIQIHCALPPEFWQGQPQIFDSRLSSWLEAKVFHERSCRAPIPVLMIPGEKNCFKLHPIKLPHASAERLVRIGTASAKAGNAAIKKDCGTAPCRPRSFIACQNNLTQ